MIVRFVWSCVRLAGVALRILLTPPSRPLALGFFVNYAETPLRHAVCPGAAFIRINFLRAKRGWNAKTLAWATKIITCLTARRPTMTIVWGTRDRREHRVDFSRLFKRCIRVERGIVDPPHAPRLAFVVSRRSIYFDGRNSTELEKQLNTLEPGHLPKSPEGRCLLDHILASGATKYPATSTTTLRPTARDLIIVGQCTGDQAIEQTDTMTTSNTGLVDLVARHLLLNGHSFERVFYKAHPLNKTNAADLRYVRERYPNIGIVDAGVSIVPLIQEQPTIATITSGVGIEAAIRGCTVHTFGVPFYSHWGFTIDHMPCSRRTNRLSPEDVFLYVLMAHTCYADPQSKRPIGALQAFLGSRA